MRLLVIEDSEKLAALMKRLLSESGFAVDLVDTVAAAAAALTVTSYDLIILDLTLPDDDGTALLCRLRQAGLAMPVLVATARSDVAQRIQTLNHGADDYIVKPFSLDELLARVRALLRRPKQMVGPILTLGNIALDTNAMTLQVDGKSIDLPRRELSVLAALLGSPGQLMPKRKLEDTIYSFDNNVTPNATEAAISRLRKRLEAHGALVEIVAMRGLGYILTERERAEP